MLYLYPPPPWENNAPDKTTRGVASATSGTVEFGSSLFWLSMKIKYFLLIGAGNSVLGMPITVLPLDATCLGLGARVITQGLGAEAALVST